MDPPHGVEVEAFLADIPPDFAILRTGSPDLTLTLADLPGQPSVIVLTPRLLAD